MTYYPPVSPYAAGLGGKCPRCGQGPLFEGFLGLRKECEICRLDYAKADSGDGPAVFVIFIVGFAAVAVAFIARFVWYAPIWMAFLISGGLAVVMILALLRPLKATMIAVQYSNKAAEGRLEE
ncbi:MAG: membrane protein [Hyphococcus sp.]|nr:MAG: membrane protein [Marinicaulis sp.]